MAQTHAATGPAYMTQNAIKAIRQRDQRENMCSSYVREAAFPTTATLFV